MAKGTTNTIEDLRLTPADNGFKVCYTEKEEKSASKGTYGNCSYEYHEEVFKDDEEATAISRFKDLKGKMRKQESSEKGEKY